MAKFFSHWSYTECGPWSYKVWMGPCPVWSSPGFYSWFATVLLFIHLGSPHFWQKLEPKASFTRMIYKYTSTADPEMLLWSWGKWVMHWENWRHGWHPIACAYIRIRQNSCGLALGSSLPSSTSMT